MRQDRTISKDTKGRTAERFGIYACYSVFFCLAVLGIFGVLLANHRSFLETGDVYKQGYFWIVELKKQIADLFAGKGFPLWTWYRGTGMEYGFGISSDPFCWIAALFPMPYLELGITLTSLLKMYFGGIVFILFAKEVRLSFPQQLIGSICYVFSAWFIEVTLYQTYFLKNIILFPLLVLGVERIYRRERPLLFILTVGYYLIGSTYFAFMAGIIIVIYIAIRYYAIYDEEPFSFKKYFLTNLKFYGYGILGVLLSCFAIFTAFETVGGASTESGRATTDLLFAAYYYRNLGMKLVGEGVTHGYGDLGLPVLILILVPVALRFLSKRSTNLILCAILAVVYMFPFLCTVMNGMTYPTQRWVFAFLFFAVWCGAEQLDPERLSKKGSMALMVVTFALLFASTIGFYKKGVVAFSDIEKVFVPAQILAGGLMLILLLAAGFRKKLDKVSVVLLLVVTIGALSVGWGKAFTEDLTQFKHNAYGYKALLSSAQRVGNQIDDDDFYRIESKTGVEHYTGWYNPANENAYWGINTVYIYNSKIPGTLLDFNRIFGNNYGYSKRVAMLSTGNRIGLDYLFGVRYFIGNDAKQIAIEESEGADPNRKKPSDYVGYGFEQMESIDNVEVFQNKYDAGLGFAYDKAISTSELLKLPRNAREQAVLQAAVVPDNELDKVPAELYVTADQLEIDAPEVPWEIVDTDGVKVKKNNKLVVEKEDGSMTIHASGASRSQVIVSFDNLQKVRRGSSFTMTCAGRNVKKYAVNEKSVQSLPVVDYDFNMSYYEELDDTFKIVFSNKGTYTYDKLYVTAMSVDNYDRFAEQCSENRYQVTFYDGRRVTGTADVKEDGIFFVSIADNAHWDIYIDGEKAEKIPYLDITFVGANISKGHHTIELRYHNRLFALGLKLSAVGAVLTVGLLIVQALRRKKSK